MQHIGLKFLGSVSMALTAFTLTGCGAVAMDDELDGASEELGTAEQAVCANINGVDGVLAAIAVASGREMRRWLPLVDFKQNTSTGMVELTSSALSRCGSNQCFNTKALLALQSSAVAGKVRFPDNVLLDPAALRGRLNAYHGQVQTCTANGSCPPPDMHDLVFTNTSAGPCGTNFNFNVYKAGTSTPLTANQVNNLAYQLKFLGLPANPFIAWQYSAGKASVDPTYGLNESSSSSSGSCTAACVKISSASAVNQCCTCNGKTARFAKSAWSTTTFICE